MNGFLFYGSDAEQIAARAQDLAQRLAQKTNPAAELVRLHGEDLTSNPEKLGVELGMRPLFGGPKIVWLTAFPAKAQNGLADAIEGWQPDISLIIQAPDLKKSHKAVQLFEATRQFAAIPCYGEDEASLPALLRQHFAAKGHEADEDALALLTARSNFSMMMAQRELEKISVYIGERRRVTLADVDACLSDQQTSETYEVVEAMLDGHEKKLSARFERLMAVDQNVTAVMLATSSALMRLHGLRSTIDAGVPAAQAVKDLRPPVFFKQQDALLRQTRIWTVEALEVAMSRLNQTLKETRLRPQLAESLTFDFLLFTARLARR